MKKLLLSAAILLTVSSSIAQIRTIKKEDITKKNSWLKAGLSASIPVGDVADYSSFAAGLELSGQFMVTRHFGMGLGSGYTHFFPKKNAEKFGIVPIGLMFRYYPKAEGFFIGTDLGYTFIVNTTNSKNGLHIKPQLGYHNYSWNIFGFYNHIFRKDGYIDVQNAGIAATYNIRFK